MTSDERREKSEKGQRTLKSKNKAPEIGSRTNTTRLLVLGLLFASVAGLGARHLPFVTILMAQSSAAGVGTSMACNGGEPYYCARDDRSIQQITPIVIPGVNQPFVLPDFGERAVRATGPNTNPATPNDRYTANSGDYYSQWGLYDTSMCSGAGGYRFVVLQHSTGPLAMEFCPKTMTTSLAAQMNFAETGGQFSHIDPAAIYGMNGSQLQVYCYPDAGTSSTAYPVCAGKAGTYTTLYDFANCPNLPAPVDARYSDPPTQDATDRYFSNVLGDAQNSWGYIFRWDKQTGACLWLDPSRFIYGGTGIAPTASPTTTPFSAFLSTPPTVTAEYTTGTIPAGTYTVGVTYNSYTWQYGTGESPLSATTQVTLTGAGGFNVTPASCTDAFWCTAGGSVQYQPSYSVYACAGTSCTPTLQEYFQLSPAADGTTKTFTATETATQYPSLFNVVPFDVINGAGTWNFTAGDPWEYYFNPDFSYWNGEISGSWSGNNFSETFATAPAAGHNAWVRWDSPNNPNLSNQTIPTTTIATLVTNGPVAPTVATTAGGGGGIHTVSINMTGSRVFFELHGTAVWNALFWNPATGAIVGCNNDQSCSGHLAFGYTKFLGVQNSANFGADPIVGNFNYGIAPIDTPDAYTSFLTGPPAGVTVLNNGTQHLSWGNDLNGEDNEPACQGGSPAGGQSLNALAPLDSEMFCFSPVTGHVWRFFHTRSMGASYVGGPYTAGGDSFWHLTLGAQSQDGKYAMMSTDMWGTLGFTQLENWATSQSHAQGDEIVDPNGNLEVESAAGNCTTNVASISWPSSFNAVTADGTCTWHLLGGLGQPFAGLNWTTAWNSNQGWPGGGYIGGVTIIDSNFNFETETVPNCYAGVPTPTWNATVGGLTDDGSCIWKNTGPSGLAFIPGAASTRTDVFIVEMK